MQSHTILGSKSQRGLTQMSLDILFRSIGHSIRRPYHPNLPNGADLIYTLQASDATEAQIMAANAFFESTYGDGERARLSRAQTPMSRGQTPLMVRDPELPGSFPLSPATLHPRSPRLFLLDARNSARSFASDHFSGPKHRARALDTDAKNPSKHREIWLPPSKVPFWQRLTPKIPPAKSFFKEHPMHHVRKAPLPLPSALPQNPDVSSYAIDVDEDADYAVLVSMYEVYNDRIFDLLSTATSGAPAMSTRQGAALQKGMLRRPLLFKNTELSPDRKVVAGLRKVVCSSYDEAVMVLETGLTERRVAGTGSNSVSSRSHGFFCIEVKKKVHLHNYGRHAVGDWSGSTLSIVDLAGSERARNAKTTGSTLAEAGKINESLMYLGQCLQVQSDCQHDGSKPIVPFRQCKLTELLFSNSFPSSSHANGSYRTPQKAVMIVTADPQGDFNATSQILRYSALAREVTVPRVPSVTSTIVGNGLKYPGIHNGRSSPQDHYFSAQGLEQANNEVEMLSEECNALSVRLAQEEIKRTEAELKLQAQEERMLVTEQEIREDCWVEMEQRIEEEKERWRRVWEEERLRGERYVDGKLEIMQKSWSPTKAVLRSPTKTKAKVGY
jgi:Kinesin motor domain